MAEVASAYVSLMPSAKGFGSKLDGQISGDIDKSGKKAGSRLGSALKGGALAALGGAAIVGGLLKGSIAEAREAQKVGALTESIIKSTGGAAKVSAADVADLAGALSLKTGMDDEAIQSGANLLLTFKNVRREGDGLNDVFGRATAAAADLSAAGFGDMSGQSKMLGKALNDPIKGISALSRSGVTFTEGQQKQIKAMVESGNVLKAQKIILGEVESQVGGAAEASATAGEKASVAFGNLKEDLGTALLPAVDAAADAFTKFAPILSDGIGKIGPAFSKAKEFVSPLVSEFRDSLEPAVSKVSDFVTGTLVPGLGNLAEMIVKNKDVVVAAVAGFVAAKAALVIYSTYVKIVTGVTAAWNVVQKLLNGTMKANPVGIVITAIGLLAAGLVLAYKKSDTFRAIVDKAFQVVGDAGKWLWENALKPAFEKMKDGFEAVGKAGTWLWNNALQPAFKFIVGGIASILDMWSDMLGALAKVPGFGWAKDAADAMANAADKARAVADGINKIPTTKTVNITVAYKYTGLRSPTRGRDDELGLNPRGKASNGPQRAFNQVLKEYGTTGENLMERIANGIKVAKPKAVAAAQDAFDALKSKMESKRDELKSTVDSLTDAFAGIRDSVKDAFTGGLFDVEATEGKSAGQAFIENLMGKKAELGGLLASFNVLKGWGVSPGFLTQLFASGNGGLINDLAAMGQQGALDTAGLFGEVTNLSTQLGTAVATNDPVTAELATANETLLRMETALAYLGGDIGKELNQAASQAQRTKKNKGKERGKK